MPFVVNTPVLNLYAEPHEESEVVSQAIYGWMVKILEKQCSFAYIQTEDQYRGWVQSHYLYEVDSDINSELLAKVVHNAVHIYAMPNVTKQKPVLTLPYEVTLKVIDEPEEENKRWVQIQLFDGRLSWIQRGNIEINPFVYKLPEMLDLSNQFIGLPYTWGGNSSFGYDCSGYVQMLFRQIGIKLPRDASLQADSPLCKPIEWNELQPGDLIFFGSTPQAIKHVALYRGNQELIHASIKPRPLIQTTSIDDLGLKQRFSYWTARHVLNPTCALNHA